MKKITSSISSFEKLRNEVYETMLKRSQEVKQFEHYRYIDRRTIEVE